MSTPSNAMSPFDTAAGAIAITTSSTHSGGVEVAMTSVAPSIRYFEDETLETLLSLLGLEAG